MQDYIIKKEAIEAMAGIQKVHYLNPQARRINKSLGDLTGLTGLGFHIIEIQPGYDSTEFHKHYFEDECIYILEGEATVTIGDQSEKVEAGDFIGFRAGGEAHYMHNDGPVTLKCIVVGQRLAHDIADYPKLGQRLYRNQGQPWNLVAIDGIEYPNAGQK